MKQRVLMAMSGGVDSSVAAALLLEQGYEVIGITMNTWTDDIPEEIQMNHHSGCCSIGAVEDARSVANLLGIPYYVMNFQGHFSNTVIDYFVDEYAKGRTPNPCIACNRYVKFSELLRRAGQLGCDYIATGHYAMIDRSPQYRDYNGRILLGKPTDTWKDQTYVLYNMDQHSLSHTLFPIGHLKKPEVREYARKLGLITADKPESQEICFVYDNDYGRFIQERTPDVITPGYIVNTNGEVIGEHRGLPFYTVGQRKGLGLTSKKPMYVVKIDAENNKLVVGEDHETYFSKMLVEDLNWIALAESPSSSIKATVKIRRMAEEVPCTVETNGSGVIITFDEPQRAITPGQAAVLYDGNWVLGGGTIEKVVE